jgi:ribonuclease BN (tRNA processing enzyme)
MRYVLLLTAILISVGPQAAEMCKNNEISAITVGTGSPRYNEQRSRPANLISYQGQKILVDMGLGTERRLQQLSLNPGDIDAMLFTHHHVDHNGEFTHLLIQSLVRNGVKTVFGPSGTQRLTEFLLDFYDEDLRYRLSKHPKKQQRTASVASRDLSDSEEFDLIGLNVKTAKVNHSIETLAYRFNSPSGSVVISGDLTYSDSLVKLAKGVDVLIVDSGALRAAGTKRKKTAKKNSRSKKNRTHTPAHAQLDEVAAMAQKANVKTLVLSHIGVPNIDEAKIRALVKTHFQGKIVIARDNLQLCI